ncbi:recombinase RecT [Thalassovita mediterranea]|nr:recombinase RecT [Thalassovita mediterranea]
MSNELEPVEKAKSLGSELTISNRGGGFLPAPTSVKDAIDFAQLMAKAGPCVGAAFRGNVGSCLAIYMQAGRLGMDPFALSTKAYLVNDNIAYEAQAVAAMVYASPVLVGRLHFRYEGEGEERKIFVTGRVKGEPQLCEYESQPLRVMRKGGRSPLWEKDPDQQMAYYATRAWARRWVPDVIMGVYTIDEMDEIDMRDVTPRDPAADRLKVNVAKFEEDRNTGRKGLKMPEADKAQDAEVEGPEAETADAADEPSSQPGEEEPDAFESMILVQDAFEAARTDLEVSGVRDSALACSWIDDEARDTIQKLAANRFDELEAEKETA